MILGNLDLNKWEVSGKGTLTEIDNIDESLEVIVFIFVFVAAQSGT